MHEDIIRALVVGVMVAIVLAIVYLLSAKKKRSAPTTGTAGGTTPPATPAGIPPATPPATPTVTTTRWVRFKAFPLKKVAIWGLALIVLLPLIMLYVVPWLFFHWIAALDYKVRGTDPKEWTGGRPTVVLPQNFSQEKSLGGPLMWNNSAKVTVQPRFGNESVKDGICFVGVIPPSMSTTFKFASYATSYGGYEASLIDVGVSGGKLPPEALQSLETARHGEATVARKLTKLSSTKRMEIIQVNNRTGRTAQSGFALNEMYLQLRGTEIPEKISINRQESARVFQYVVEVGVEETLFMLPTTSWECLWVVPVHHKAYQASLDGQHFPSTGGPKNGLLAVEYTINGEPRVLESAQLFRESDLTSGEVRMRLMFPLGPPGDSTETINVKPAKIIVGIQL